MPLPRQLRASRSDKLAERHSFVPALLDRDGYAPLKQGRVFGTIVIGFVDFLESLDHHMLIRLTHTNAEAY